MSGIDWALRMADVMAMLDLTPGSDYFVDTINGDDANDGLTWAHPFKTMAKALATVQTLGKVYFVGDVREELTGSHLKFDISIIGCGSLHHPDLPSAAYHPGASMWRPPASPTAATPLLKVRGRGWKFFNVVFDCPVDHAAVKLERNALSGTSEYDSSHTLFHGCTFRQGKWGIYDESGTHNVVVEDCEFFIMSEAAIKFGNVAVIAAPLKWTIRRNVFCPNGAAGGNASHLISPLTGSVVLENVFGPVTSTAKYVDLTGGSGNVVSKNVFGGVYDTDDYVAGTDDIWPENYVAAHATTAPDGRTLAVPGAP